MVVLRKNSQYLRTLDSCNLKSNLFHFGTMGVVLPKGAKAKASSGFDTSGASIEYKKSVLGFVSGPSWSAGYPTWPSFYEDTKQLWEGEIRGRQGVWFAEYKGVRRNGMHFHWIGAYGITFSYDDTSKDAATYFDEILNSLCWYSEP